MKCFLKFKTLCLVLSILAISITSVAAANSDKENITESKQARIIECPDCSQVGNWTYWYNEDTGEVFMIECNICGYEYYY